MHAADKIGERNLDALGRTGRGQLDQQLGATRAADREIDAIVTVRRTLHNFQAAIDHARGPWTVGFEPQHTDKRNFSAITDGNAAMPRLRRATPQGNTQFQIEFIGELPILSLNHGRRCEQQQ